MVKNNEYDVEFGKFIKKGRDKKKLTQKAVAEPLGMSQAFYSMLERGKRPVDLETATKICDILGIDLRDFEYVSNNKTDHLIEKEIEPRAGKSIGEMLTGKIEKKSEGKSVSIYLTTDALENLERFAKANGCSKSKAADLILRNLY